MRSLYSKFFSYVAERLDATDDTLQECYLEACKDALRDYIDERSVDDIDTPMLRSFVNFVKRIPTSSSNNVIPLKKYTNY